MNRASRSLRKFTDVGKQKRVEKALKESERRLADIIDFLPDATLVIDCDGKVIAWNRAIEEMTGVKAKDMLGKGNYEYALPFYGKRRPIVIDLLLKPDKKIEKMYSVLRKEKGMLVTEAEVPFVKRKSAHLWAKASLLYDTDGNVVGAIESIRDMTKRKQAEEALKKRERELENKNIELEDLNAALRVLLKQRENDRKELEEKMLLNIKTLILPYIERLKNRLDSRGKTNVEIITSNLNEITSSFTYKLHSKYLNLTNKEIQIANQIREEKTTKDISEDLNISESAINIHRYRIRKKLGLTKKDNLKSYLLTLI